MFKRHPKARFRYQHIPRPRIWLLCLILGAGLILPGGYCHAQTDTALVDSIIWFNARILDLRSGQPVQFAHIVNTRLGNATISDTLGYFRLRVVRGTELQITAIGYSLRRQALDDSILAMTPMPEISLIPHIYPINSVNVNPLGSYDQFRKRFIDLIPPEPRYKVPEIVLKDISMGLDTIRSLSPRPIAHPITYLYNLWSREGKEMRRMAEILEEEEFMRGIQHKYSPEIISRITGYTGLTLNEFLDFCKFDRQFLRDAGEYGITEAVLEKQEEFEELRR